MGPRHVLEVALAEVARTDEPMNQGTRTRTGVFISYSRKDRDVLERLKVFLAPFERQGTIQCWDDTRIQPGKNWRAEIQQALSSTKVAVLLVTGDFMSSRFIAENELPPLLAAAQNEGTIILPVIVAPSAFEEFESLSRFQAVNDPKRPLKGLRGVERDQVFVKVARAIREACGAGAQRPAASATDKEEAVRWLREAAEAGDAGAQAELGAWYALGTMTARNDAEAFKWLHAAAEKGHPQAQYNLALIYERGIGVAKDHKMALALLRTSAEQGHADAQYYMGQSYRMGEEGLSPDYHEAREWYSKAARQGHVDALNNLGAMWESGLGGPTDNVEALKCFRQAAEEGDPSAEHNMGIIYREGKCGVSADPAEAYKWFRRSAEHGDANGQNQLGVHLASGLGTEQNDAEAAEWFEKSADQGQAQAEFNLGVFYAQGRGVTVDYAKAIALFRKAADQDHPEAKKILKSLGGNVPSRS
jgi:TPR repeat protein